MVMRRWILAMLSGVGSTVSCFSRWRWYGWQGEEFWGFETAEPRVLEAVEYEAVEVEAVDLKSRGFEATELQSGV